MREIHKKYLSTFICFVLLILSITSTLIFNAKNPILSISEAATASNRITKNGTGLFLNGQVFRFFGANLYWLGLDENSKDANNVTIIDYPTKFRIDDAMQTAKEMGVTVIRSQTLGVSTGCAKCIEPTLNQFNDAAFDSIDYAIKSASENGIHLMIPLTDQWNFYHGGKHNFTDWRGISDPDQFHINTQVIQDFKNYLSHLLNHVNKYTGIALKDDPTIMAWETGNELYTVNGNLWSESWTDGIAAYVKSLSPNTLVADGRIGNSEGSHLLDQSLNNPNIDIMGVHHYPMKINDLQIDMNKVTSHNKVFVIGEYDWTNTKGGDSLSSYLNFIEQNNVTGDIFWSLMPHDDRRGFIKHNDGFTLNYPGITQDMKIRSEFLRTHGYKMQNKTTPNHIIPTTPLITSITKSYNGIGYNIIWRGSVGANNYNIERSSDNINWQTVGSNVNDTDFDLPPYSDQSATGTNIYYYRIVGVNIDGVKGNYSLTQTTDGQTLTITPGVTTTVSTTTCTKRLQGDINCDGTIDQSDFTSWKQYFLNKNLSGDINNDGKIDLIDFETWRKFLS